MATIWIYTIFYALVILFTCRPLSAYWDHMDPIKLVADYKFQCFDEGAKVITNGIIATVQDFIAALLPTILCWKLQLSRRDKVALFSVLTLGYTTVIVSSLRTRIAYRMFYVTYDATWLCRELWLWNIFEIHIGILCGNAPAVKFFVTHILKDKFWTRLRFADCDSHPEHPVLKRLVKRTKVPALRLGRR